MESSKPVTATLSVGAAREIERLNYQLEKQGKALEKVTEKLKAATSASSSSGGGGLDALAGLPDVSTDYKSFFGALFGDIAAEAESLFGRLLPKKDEGEKKDETTTTGDGKSTTPDSTQASVTGDTQESEAEKAAAAEKKREKANAEAWAGIVGNALKSSKALAKIRKAFAIGGVVMDTARGIAKAVASAPFPANLPAIAFATVTGAAQLAAVKGQAHAGIDRIPSTGTYLLEQGERVVGSRLNADLSRFLDQNRGTGGPQGGASSTTTNTLAPSIHLSIGPDTPPDSVHRNRGALESMIREIFADYALEAPFG